MRKNKKSFLIELITIGLMVSMFSTAFPLSAWAEEPRTAFQSGRKWQAELNLPVDLAFVYSSSAETIQSWRDHGYETWVMLGASWLGKETDIVVEHPEIKQTTSDGVPFEMIPGRAWVVPARPWIDWFNKRIDEAIAGGARGILPEEPEFFAPTGYSESFKQAWNEYYGEPWRDPQASTENYWLAGRLKAHLFEEFFREVCAHVKEKDPAVVCMVPTHSNLNYTDWKILTPHHAYLTLEDVDGYIGQVWTGTAKHPHMLGGEAYASVFEYGFLEYSYFAELVRGTDTQMWFLTDPVEDAPGAPWSDLRGWYEDTLTAALMFPGVNRYEVTPWPGRVFLDSKTYGGSLIPKEYAHELLAIWKEQGKIPVGGEWPQPVNDEIGFLTADTAMWQTGKGMNRFGGHVAPMLAAVRAGIPARVMPAERFAEEGYPQDDVKVVVASFDAWKPADATVVDGIAKWVKDGGTLLYLGGADAYDDIPSSWWRKAGKETPSQALLEALGLNLNRCKSWMPTVMEGVELAALVARQTRTITPAAGAPDSLLAAGDLQATLPLTACKVEGAQTLFEQKGKPIIWRAAAGKGTIIYAGYSGEYVAAAKGGVDAFLALLKFTATEVAGVEWREPTAWLLKRGPYVMGRCLSDECSVSGAYRNLLQPGAPEVSNPVFSAGQNIFIVEK